jgi:hypothetical protein
MTSPVSFTVTFPSRPAVPVLVVQRPSGSTADLRLSEPSFTAGSAVFTFTPDVSGQYNVSAPGTSQLIQGTAGVSKTVTFNFSTWSRTPPTGAQILTAPGGSVLRGASLTFVGISATARYQFTPDVGGIFVMQDGAGNTLASIEALPTQLTRKVTSTAANHSATLTISVLAGVVIATGTAPNTTPSLTAPSDATAGFAVQDAAVVSALAAMIGMNAATIGSTGLPSVTSAFQAACVTPPAISTEDTATPVLVAAGWAKA